MKKRLLPLLLALCLLLSACGAQSAGDDVTPDGTPNNTADDTTPDGGEADGTSQLSPEEQAEQEKLAQEQALAQRINEKIASMTIEEKVGQLFFVRCPESGAAEDVAAYHLGGILLFGRDFKDANGNWLTAEQLRANITSYQDASEIPLFIGSDEEGGTVTRASRNPNLFAQQSKSPQALYAAGGMDAVLADTAEKNRTLRWELGINVNFAPVADVSTDPGDFIYDRALGQDAEATADYVARVVLTMQDAGIASVLKHFPGYGNNVDTHTGIAVDERSYESFEQSDLLPFIAGIEAGAPFVLVSHNIVKCMDEDYPASLSKKVHGLLRGELGFDGLIVTDDLAMDAVKAYADNGSVAVLALQAGNDMIVTTDYQTQIPLVIEAVRSGEISEDEINDHVFRVLHTKAALGLE